MTDFYKLLDLDKSCNENDIKKAYKKKALIFHPDRNKDNIEESTKKFNEIKLAYDCLIDNEKRKMYDLYGIDGIKDMDGVGMNMHDLFSRFGGGGFSFDPFSAMGGEGFMKKKQDINVSVVLNLSELYNGCIKTIFYKRKIMCSKCYGYGASKNNILECYQCKGSGFNNIKQGPMVIMSMCQGCYGKKNIIKDNCECKKCLGNKIIEIEEELEINIPKDIDFNKPIIVNNNGNYNIDSNKYSDLNIKINLLNHDLFKRDGYDLYIKKDIDLYSSLFSARFVIKHLDDTYLYINHKDIIKPNTKKKIYGKGLKTNNGSYGNLIIEFNLILPEDLNNIDEDQRKILKKIFKIDKNNIKEEIKDKKVLKCNLEDYENHNSSNSNNYDSDSDQEEINEGVTECVQQ